MTDKQSCPVCERTLSEPPDDTLDRVLYCCEHCGQFGFTRTAAVVLGRRFEKAERRLRAVFSHYLQRMQQTDKWPVVNSDVAQKILETGALPSPREQADNFVRWLGDATNDDPGEMLDVGYDNHGAIIGAPSNASFMYVVNQLKDAGLVDCMGFAINGPALARLTFDGWGRYEELRLGAPSGRVAFMAMKFGDPQLDGLVGAHFAPAVESTGFRLKRLDDNPKAGLIDDRLRVEIKACRFLIADLTHANNGAYWEAGYAEGLGKPVIYTCEKSAFHKASHFDTNHHLTVLWEPNSFEDAARRLIDTIRATIPEASRSTL